ncbi:MAG: response regulator [Chloroflexota bacterium]
MLPRAAGSPDTGLGARLSRRGAVTVTIERSRINTLQVTVGAFCAIMGASILVVPYHFGGVTYAVLQPYLPEWGVAFLLAGPGLIATAVLAPRRSLVVGVHGLAGAVLLLVALGFGANGAVTGLVVYGVLGLGTAAAPFLAADRRDPVPGDLFVLLMALTSTLIGAVTRALPGPAGAAFDDPQRIFPIAFGVAFLAGGLILLFVQVRRAPNALVWIGHLIVGVTFCAFAVLVARPSQAWTGVAYFGGFGVVVALLPGLGPVLGRVDRTSLRTRLALTLIAVACVPLVVALAAGADLTEGVVIAQAATEQKTLATTRGQNLRDYVRLHLSVLPTVTSRVDLFALAPPAQRAALGSLVVSDVFAFSTYAANGAPIARSDDLSLAPLPPALLDEVRRTHAPAVLVTMSPQLHRPVFVYAASALDRTGQVRGFLAAESESATVAASLAALDPNRETGTSVRVVDGDGRVIIDPDSMAPVANVSRDPAVAAMLASSGSGALRIRTATGGQLAGYARIAGLGWGVIVERPTAEILATIDAERDLAFALLLLAIAGSAVVGVFVADRLAAPLGTLARAVDRLSTGDAAAPLPRSGIAEVERLASLFGQMRDRLAARTAERAEAEEELQHLNADLARRVDERTARLQQTVKELESAVHGLNQEVAERRRLEEQVRGKNDELERASRLKSEFLANMSHELRTPLNAILGFTELLLDDTDGQFSPETRGSYLDTVHQSGTHLLALINDILDLAKIEAGRVDLQVERFAVPTLVDEVVTVVRPLALRKRIDVITDVAEAGELVADPGKTKQILYNLLANAIKFTPEHGKVTVTARARPGAVRLSVTDTGIGIATADQQRIFEEFQQVESGPERRYEGTGLGLALTRRLVALHRGEIWVESTLGEGSRFHVVLPNALGPAPSTPEESPFAAEPIARDGEQPLVLVVEDDPRAAHLLAYYLDQGGYRTAVAKDGDQAIHQARELQPRAILLDIFLPTLDGWDVLRALKRDDAVRDVPVIIVSMVDDAGTGHALGAVDYFVKPIERDALLKCLARLTRAARTAERDLRVLIVDDDLATLDLLTAMLTPEGFRTLRATGGADAIRLAARERPSVIVLDLVMPEINGFDVIDAVHRDPATREIPILAVTAKDLTPEDKAILTGRVAAVLQKGSSLEIDLLSWLNRLGQPVNPTYS